MDRDEVLKIAALSMLAPSDDEVSRLTRDLSAIVGYIDQLKTVNVDNVEPMSHVHGSVNIMREDVAEPSMPVEQALKNAPDRSGQFIRVPIIIAE